MLKRIAKQFSLISAGVVFAVLTLVFFRKVFFKGLLPIPADITVGLYYPWLDYRWGFSVGVPVKNPLPSDIPSLVYPWRMLVIEHLKRGVLPLWNPYYFAGMPLLANFQSAVFSLANLFHFFLPFPQAWSAGIIIQPFLIGLFTFLFLRHLRLSRVASLFGGIIFAFSGFSLMWLEYNVHGHAVMWLPLLLLLTDKIIETRRLTWALLAGLVLALQILAGYPQIVLYSLTAIGFDALFRLFLLGRQARNFRRLGKIMVLLFLFVFLGLLLAAVQLLPGQEALKLSVRKIDPIAANSSGGFLPWQNLITFLAPDFFGNPATYNFWGCPWYDNFALYVGILPLLLASLALFLRRDKLSWFFAFLAFFALVIALPTPVAKIIAALGIYGVKAISARIIFLLDFALAVLAALGLDWLVSCGGDPKSRQRNFRSVLAVIFGFLLMIGGLWLFVLTAPRVFPEAKWLVNLAVTKRNLILPTGLLVASALVLIAPFLLRRFRFPRLLSFVLAGIFLLSIFDLFRFGWKYLPFSKPELIFPTTPVIEFLQKQKPPFRVEFGETIPQNMWIPYGLESAAGYDALAPLRYSQFLGALRTGRTDTPYGRVAEVENYDSKLFDLLNIKYLLAVKYDEKGIRSPAGKPKPIFRHPKFKLVFEDKTVQVYENLQALPRAFWVYRYRLVKDGQKIIDTLLSHRFELQKEIVLEEKPDFIAPRRLIKPGQVEWLKYEREKLVLRVFSDQPGFLFLANNYYPGWQAFIDSQPVKIYRANYTFMAVKVPEGRHLVEFHYQPRSFLFGGLISGFALANLLLVSGVLIIRSLWLRK